MARPSTCVLTTSVRTNPTSGLGTMGSANESQVGGRHYRELSVQPWDVIQDWQLGFFDGNALKYLARWRKKGGVDDLKKARHYIEKLIEVEEQGL